MFIVLGFDDFSAEIQCLPCSLFSACGHNEVKYSGWVGHRVLYIRGGARDMRPRTWPDDAQCHQVNNVLTPEHLANVSRVPPEKPETMHNGIILGSTW